MERGHPLTSCSLGRVRPSLSRAPGAVLWAVACASSTRIRFAVPCSSYGWPPRGEEARVMQVESDEPELIERVAALDVGKAEVVCCVRIPGPGGQRMQEVRTVSTMTAALLALGDWMAGLDGSTSFTASLMIALSRFACSVVPVNVTAMVRWGGL